MYMNALVSAEGGARRMRAHCAQNSDGAMTGLECVYVPVSILVFISQLRCVHLCTIDQFFIHYGRGSQRGDQSDQCGRDDSLVIPLVFPEENINAWITSSHNFQHDSTLPSQNEREHNRSEWGFRNYAYDVLVSDKIGPNRTVQDTRHELCHNKTYPVDMLPSASIVICYHNEAISVLIRMINSILQRTPDHLINEILLIDDYSKAELIIESYLKEYGESRWPTQKIKYIRSDQRLGLIRCRVNGSRIAHGEVLVFLDSHCEMNEMWLEPLLSRLTDNPHSVVMPIVDLIDPRDFAYDPSMVTRGGFSWAMTFHWMYFNWTYFEDPENYTRPIRSPAISGGLFAVRKEYFHYVGEFDTGMDIWGGENVEFSIRVWTCGGRMEVIPCSRVGHVFRSGHSYSDGTIITLRKNALRAVLVWLDEYKEKFLAIHPNMDKDRAGDISERIELRKRLQCKPFQWYIDNVYPELLTY